MTKLQKIYSCIAIIAIIVLTYATVLFFNSDYYWNKIVLKKSLEVQNLEKRRFDVDSKMIFYPKKEKICGIVYLSYKDKEYFKNIKCIIEEYELEEKISANLTFVNRDGFEVRNEDIPLRITKDGFIAEFNIKADKKEVKEINKTVLIDYTKLLSLDDKMYKRMQEVASYLR